MESDQILKCISKEIEKFCDVCDDFYTTLESSILSSLNKLVFLLLSNTLKIHERFNVIFILFHDKHGENNKHNHFLPHLLDYFWKAHSHNYPEIIFMYKLFLNEDLSDSSAKTEMEKTLDFETNHLSKKMIKKIASIQNSYEESSLVHEVALDQLSSLKKIKELQSLYENSELLKNEKEKAEILNNPQKQIFTPRFVRFFPEIDDESQEFEWIYPTPFHSILWEENIYNNGFPQLIEVESLLSAAFSSTPTIDKLSQEQEETIVLFFDNQSEFDTSTTELIKQFIKPTSIKSLSEKYPNALASALYFLLRFDNEIFKHYFSFLVKQTMTKGSLEVMKRLATKNDLENIKSVISECVSTGIQTFEARESEGSCALSKAALANDFFEFVIDLYRSKRVVLSPEIVAQLKTLCISQSKVKNASVLYKMINKEN